ncbi:MAG: Holliday junction resolvase RuvX [Planctomycetaceae bacterium]|nr:Holliday junction resolvase RuvX [Planctomycetaceae bacterium]MBP60357.1 Holliday junction resolvase RuvX [Planctomycetaceae bacterium]
MTISDSGRLAGIDYGTVRIGVAVTDFNRTIASPYDNYQRKNTQADGTYFLQLVREEDIVGFVVGLPVHLSGEESQKSQEARQFADWLYRVTSVPVDFFDERFTSVQAESFLIEAGFTRQKRKQRRDKLAAQIMLAAYLENQERPDRRPGPIED